MPTSSTHFIVYGRTQRHPWLISISFGFAGTKSHSLVGHNSLILFPDTCHCHEECMTVLLEAFINHLATVGSVGHPGNLSQVVGLLHAFINSGAYIGVSVSHQMLL